MKEQDIAKAIKDMEERMVKELQVIFKGDAHKGILFTFKYQMAVQQMLTMMMQELGIEETHQILEMYFKFNKEVQELANKMYTN